MANWQVLMKMSLSSTGIKDDADVANDAIFSERPFVIERFGGENWKIYRLGFFLPKKENRQLTLVRFVQSWRI